MPHGDFVLEGSTLDEIWRLLCTVMSKDPSTSRAARPHEDVAGARLAEAPEPPATGENDPEAMSVAELATMFGE